MERMADTARVSRVRSSAAPAAMAVQKATFWSIGQPGAWLWVMGGKGEGERYLLFAHSAVLVAAVGHLGLVPARVAA